MIQPRPLALIALLVAALAAPAIASTAITSSAVTASTTTTSPPDIASAPNGAQLKTRVRGFELGSGARVDGEGDAAHEHAWGIGDALRRNASGSLLAARGTTVGPKLLVNARLKAIDILRPGGRLVGSPGSSSRIRILEGGQSDATALFRQLVHETGATPIAKPGLTSFAEIPGGGGSIGFRSISTTGPPTIDVRIPGLGIREIKFVPGAP